MRNYHIISEAIKQSLINWCYRIFGTLVNGFLGIISVLSFFTILHLRFGPNTRAALTKKSYFCILNDRNFVHFFSTLFTYILFLIRLFPCKMMSYKMLGSAGKGLIIFAEISGMN